MATANLSDFVRRLARGMAAGALGDHSDGQLVDRALAGRDEAAFQAIVDRHGPMVYRVCRRLLRHPQDAEDAFQSTFLVLARRLRTLRKRASLASWLHGVALRVALKARAQSAAQRRRERHAARPGRLPPDEVTWGELRSALDAELSRLPDRWRLPLVLCYLEGRTQDEAAGQMGCSKSTLRRRLEEGRAALCGRLTRRGLVWPAALSAVLLSDCLAPAGPAPGLVASAARAAAGVAAGKTAAAAASARVAALTEGVLRAMFLTKLRMATAVLFFLGLLTTGAGGFSHATRATAQAESRREAPAGTGKTPPGDVEIQRALAALEAARARVRLAKADLDAARDEFLAAHERYETARRRGRPKEPRTEKGVLCQVDAGGRSVRVEMWLERKFPEAELWGGITGFGGRFYETFPVAKGATIVQDNVRTGLASLKKGSHVALGFAADGKSVVRITADGGSAQGRFVSANPARSTIAVLAGKGGERRVYHLVKETEVLAGGGKAARVADLKEGTMLLLTLSVEDANTAIRIETVSAAKGKER
jgi:RNA polymerase sigma factor (sigma-70 family)